MVDDSDFDDISNDNNDPTAAVVALVPDTSNREELRIVEALLFASAEPVSERDLVPHLPEDANLPALLEEIEGLYAQRGVNLVRRGNGWAFRTAPDLRYLLERHTVVQRRLSRAALETLAIIAYHQPVTRAEIEEIRGVATSKGTLDVLMETEWVRIRGRRRAPGRPVTYGTTEHFLDHFGLETARDLPGYTELKGAGLLDSELPEGFEVPEPRGLEGLEEDEEPLEDPLFDLDSEDGDDDGDDDASETDAGPEDADVTELDQPTGHLG